MLPSLLPRRRFHQSCLVLLLGLWGLWLPPVTASPSPSANPRLEWWREARLGLFIHWGPVSLAGTEIGWSRGDAIPTDDYDMLFRSFNPSRFNAREWARLARDMGAGYVVLTSKHHDGFCLWDSELTDYDISATPFQRDIMAELAQACRREGLVFCAYHSICDWRHPDYPLGSPGGRTTKPGAAMERYLPYLHGQVAEILRNHGPIGILWFDGEWETPWTEEMGRDLYALCRRLQPDILVNNRVAKGRLGMAGITRDGTFAGDYDTPEQAIGQFQTERAWESCITLCTQWAWKPNDTLKSLNELITTLVTCAGGDGNLLLNVGPMPSGLIEPRQARRLRELGRWLERNGRSIYETRGGPFLPGPWGVSTQRDNSIYLHVLDWQGAERIVLPPLDREILAARTSNHQPVFLFASAEGLEILKPPGADNQPDTIIELTVGPQTVNDPRATE